MKTNKRKFTTALIILVFLIALIFPLKNKLQSLVGFKEKELKSVAKLDLNWEDEMDTKSYKDIVLVVDKTKLTAYGYDGKKAWNKDVKEDDEVHLGESSVFINNTKNMMITKYSLDGEDLWTYNINHPAYTVTEIGSHLFIYSKVDESTRSITVLDKDGKSVIDKEKSKEEILSANIDKDKNSFIITSMDTSSPELKSKITYLSHDGEVIWTEEIQDKMIYNILFLDNDMLLIGDREIICIDKEGKTLWEKDIKYNLKDIKIINKEEIYILYGEDDSYLEVLNIDGKIEYKKNFKKAYENIEEFNKHVLLLGKSGITGLNNKKISMREDFKGDIKQVKKTKDQILIASDKKIEIFKIINKEEKKD